MLMCYTVWLRLVLWFDVVLRRTLFHSVSSKPVGPYWLPMSAKKMAEPPHINTVLEHSPWNLSMSAVYENHSWALYMRTVHERSPWNSPHFHTEQTGVIWTERHDWPRSSERLAFPPPWSVLSCPGTWDWEPRKNGEKTFGSRRRNGPSVFDFSSQVLVCWKFFGS